MRPILLAISGIGVLATATPGLAQAPRAPTSGVVVGHQEAQNFTAPSQPLQVRSLRRTMIDRRGTEQIDLQIVQAERARSPIHHFRLVVRDGTLVGYGRGLNRPPRTAASIRPIRLTGRSPEDITDEILTIEPRPASELGRSIPKEVILLQAVIAALF